ncbi:MAG: hypothetical protein QG670_542 [Thermoproteota archaeon]|nr:hypothetical protein [Thermoproteota archaeon]
MSRDEDFSRWFRKFRRSPLFGLEDFEDFDRMMDEMFKEMIEDLPKDLYKERKLPNGRVVKEMGPFVYGYSMTVDSDGKPVIREFGNVKPSTKATHIGVPKPSFEYKEEREPLVDVINESDAIRVIAEIPGIDKKDINLSCSERTLTISVDTEKRKYYKEIELPEEIDPKIAKATYTNGVLEVTLTKIREKKPKGEKIRIE